MNKYSIILCLVILAAISCFAEEESAVEKKTEKRGIYGFGYGFGHGHGYYPYHGGYHGIGYGHHSYHGGYPSYGYYGHAHFAPSYYGHHGHYGHY